MLKIGILKSNGKAIMKQFEIATGPTVGQIKNFLTEMQVREDISDPEEMNRRLEQLDISRFAG